jgi:hypothetical protein
VAAPSPEPPALRAAWPLSRPWLSRSAGAWCALARAGASRFQGAETKTGRALELPFPEAALERYLAGHRSVLAAQRGRAPGTGTAGEALWLPAARGRLSAGTLAFHVTELTRAAFGRPVNLHLFRNCAATSLAIEDLGHTRLAAQVLGHVTFTTTEKHYNLARIPRWPPPGAGCSTDCAGRESAMEVHRCTAENDTNTKSQLKFAADSVLHLYYVILVVVSL